MSRQRIAEPRHQAPTHGVSRHRGLGEGVFAAVLASSCVTTQALTLGGIEILSTLGQPLAARVVIPQMSATDASSVRMALGSAAEYRAAGLKRDPALADALVQFVPATRTTPAHVRIIGTRVVNEPVLNLIVSANWPAGGVRRHYPLLIDPPGGVTSLANPAATAPMQ